MTAGTAKGLFYLFALAAVGPLVYADVTHLIQVPVFFEPNHGQFEASVQYVGRMADVPIGLFADGVGFEATSKKTNPAPIRMRFLGMEGNARWTGMVASPGVSNYLTSAGSVTQVERYQKARANNIYSGIDVEVHGAGSQMEYDFIVHPGADPSRIRYSVDGSGVDLDPKGELVMHAGTFELHNHAPQLYQELNGVRTPVEGHFAVHDHVVSFKVGKYDTRHALVIDPIVFAKAISASGYSFATSATTDSAGNVFVVGYADSAFASTGAQKTYGGGSVDAVVMKFSASGDVVWSTFLGGSGADYGSAVMIDSTGGILVAGDTESTNFPMVGNSYQKTNKGKRDAFVVRLNAQGSAVLYSTYFGGTDDDYVNSAVLDASGNVLLGGATFSTDLPTAGTTVLQAAAGGSEDMYLSKLSTPLTAQGQLILSTYLGRAGQDELKRVALDAAGNIYVAGWTTSTTFVATAGAAQSALAGQNDNVIVRLNPTATTIQMLTYLGGSLADVPNGLAVEPDGSAIWVAGMTNSSNFPTTAGALQRVLGGGEDGTLVKLDNKGALLASTFLGGPGDDEGDAVVSQNGIPVYVGVLTTDQYNKASADRGIEPRATSTRAQLSFEIMKADLSDTTATITYSPDNAAIDYVGSVDCQASTADANKIVCGGAGFPLNGAGNPQGDVLVVSTAVASSGSTDSFPFVIQQPRQYKGLVAVSDPVDGSTGSFYDTITDLQLGGPLPVQFARFYSSTLSSGGFLSPLGTNWMSNFDLRIDANTTTARVLLFGGNVINFTKSGSAWQLGSPLDVAYQLTQSASAYKLMDPTTTLVYTFNTKGALTRIEDRNGNAITVTQGIDGPVSATDSVGRTLNFTYASGHLTKVQDQTGTRTVSYTYNGSAETSSVDLLGQTTTYAYTSAGALTSLMTARQYPLGARVTQTYDTTGRVTSQTLPTNNKTTAIAYDGQGGTKITDTLGNVTSQSFDAGGDVIGFKDPTNAAFTVTYDSAGRRTGYTDKNGGTVTITYNTASGKVATRKTAAGLTTSYTYTTQTQGGFTFYPLASVSYGDGTSSSYVYDARGNLTQKTDRAGAITKYAYDAFGNPTTVTLPTNAVTTYTYNTDFTVATTTDALNNTNTYGYDAQKRVNKVTESNGSVTNYTYDLAGDVLSAQQPIGSTNTTTFDADGRRSSYTYAGGGTSTFAYTKTGNVATLTNPTGGKRSYTYNALDLLDTIQDPSGVSSSYTYDASGQVQQTSLGGALLYRYGYDKEGNVTSILDGSNRTWTYSFDGDGRRTGMTPPGGGVFGLKFDGAGRVIGQTNPAGGSVNLTLDGDGRVVQKTVANTLTTALKRNTRGSVTELTDPNGNKWGFGFDALERPTSLTDPLGNTTNLSYTKNRVTGVTLPLGTVTLTNDANGRITKRAFSDGTNLNISYDARGLISTADGFTVTRDAAGLPNATNGIAVALDPAGKAKSFTYAAGKAISYSYDAAGRVTGVTDWVGGTTAIEYDGAGRIVAITYPNGVRTTQAYDANGRVNRIVSGGLANITLTRDVLGQITSAERNLPTTPALTVGSTTSSYDAASQLAGATYDKMGRATSQNGRTYTWNLASQLTGFTANGQSTMLTYDGLAELASSTTGGVTRNYVFNHLLHYPGLSIIRQGGSDLRYYVYLPDGQLLYSVEASGARHFYHFDEMGNTTFLTGDDGKVTDTYAITPFGDVADHTGSTDNPFTYQGQVGILQEAPGLYFMRSRHYDATTARFLSRDPLVGGDPVSGTPYVYAENNPMFNIDPYGTLANDQAAALVTAYLSRPTCAQGADDDTCITAEARQAIYSKLADALESSYSRGKVGPFEYLTGRIWLSVAYNHADLDLTAFFAIAYPPDPPPPPPPPAPAVTPAPATLHAPKQTGVLLAQQSLGPALSTLPGRLVSPTGAPIISDNSEGVLSDAGGNVISNDGGTVISNDGGTVISKGGTIISQDGNSKAARIISQDGNSLLGTSANTAISQ
ncbi:MAG: SBBP repeat-containing protein [Acidobacteriota bacterium]